MAIGTIQINFWGICTFMAAEQAGVPPSQAWGNRYVLVDASNPAVINENRFLANRQISPHYAELQIAVQDLVTISNTDMAGFSTVDPPIYIPDPPPAPSVAWRLNNVLLSIANAVPGPPPTNPQLPNLSAYIEGIMPPPALAMTMHPIPTRAAAFFDFFTGNLESKQTEGGAIIGQLTVETLGNPQIRVRSFADPMTTISIELQSGAEVVVGNGPQREDEDRDQDWLLHYLTCSEFPDVIAIPSRRTLNLIETYNPPRWDPRLMLTVGCSNSTYP